MTQTPDNIEALTSKIAYEIVNEGILNENEINKLLGVLANNGVYAMWVYVLDKMDTSFVVKDDNKIQEPKLYKLIFKLENILYIVRDCCLVDNLKQKITNKQSELNKKLNETTDDKKKQKIKSEISKELTKEFINDTSTYFQLLSEDLHKLLFLKQLLEKILVYARYHAKALGD